MENIPFEDLKNNPILIFNLGCSYRDNLERWLHSQRINAAKNMVQIHLIPKAYSEISTIFIRRADNYVTKPMDKLIETIDHFHHIQNPADIDPLASVFKDIQRQHEKSLDQPSIKNKLDFSGDSSRVRATP